MGALVIALIVIVAIVALIGAWAVRVHQPDDLDQNPQTGGQ